MLIGVERREGLLGMCLNLLHRALLGLVAVTGVVGALTFPAHPSMAASLFDECAPLPTFITRG
jgi:hypothetical protein